MKIKFLHKLNDLNLSTPKRCFFCKKKLFFVQKMFLFFSSNLISVTRWCKTMCEEKRKFEKNEIYGKMLEAKFFFSRQTWTWKLEFQKWTHYYHNNKTTLKGKCLFCECWNWKVCEKEIGYLLTLSGPLRPIFNNRFLKLSY